MNRKSLLTGLLVLSLAAAAGAQEKPGGAMKGTKMKGGGTPTDQQLIASAMKAAPMSVGKNATVIVMDEKMNIRTVRKGTNGWTCMPDNPETPGPDPMCMDANAMLWIQAWIAHQNPPSGKVGLMYMLAGGTDASNTDPYATKPTAANHWIKTGPHVMIVGGDESFLAQYPKNADPDTSAPYVMWAGTPYQHLMTPVK
jgi:hypothetical protein